MVSCKANKESNIHHLYDVTALDSFFYETSAFIGYMLITQLIV